ncbi:hypothetical protein QBC47DRAFT_376966 [Echria macrotheca]|uniref:Uncharacterized protein n=1 Tax=Echria macrotheca TaxID=438768 RepID=A0AAJ0BGE0_9PEZI|nr:hypothetical protein QBC47DRAFT_376966 [Echria macrotheca]
MVAQSRLFAAALAATTSTITTTQPPKPCDYSTPNRCINPQSTAAAPVPFAPLLHTPPKFVYAVDALSEADKAALLKRSPWAIPSTYLGPVLQAAFWLEYDQNALNDSRAQSRNYYTFALETSASNDIGGGCESLLGETCLANLKLLIASKTYGAPDGIDGGLGTAIGELYAAGAPPAELGCPADIFGTRWDAPNQDMPILLGQFEPFARYSNEFVREALPPGNASFTHGIPQLRFRSLAEQSKRGVVGVTVGWPTVAYGEEPNYLVSEVTVDTVCLRLGSSGSDGVEAARSSGGEDGVRSRHHGDL